MADYTGYIFSIERDFDPAPTTVLLRRYWWASIPIGLAYFCLIRMGQRWMADRPPFKLQATLQMWNYSLALFSAVGLARCTIEMWWVVGTHGLNASICTQTFAHSFIAYWVNKFAYSKLFELGDTAFLVLRKRPVGFLHWYHHITVMIYTWHSVKDHTIAGRWFVWMNFLAHTLMYTYYAVCAGGKRFPKIVSMSVTTVQIMQMFVGLYVAFVSLATKLNGDYCHQTYENLVLCFAMYASYFGLFLHYFYKAYLTNKPHKPSIKTD